MHCLLFERIFKGEAAARQLLAVLVCSFFLAGTRRGQPPLHTQQAQRVVVYDGTAVRCCCV